MLTKSKYCCAQILAESDQMRKEADDTGPLAELDHWRQLMARFNSILDQIKSQKCRMAINIVNTARSKVIKVRLQMVKMSVMQLEAKGTTSNVALNLPPLKFLFYI